MQRYKRGVKLTDHTLEKVFSEYAVTKETEFVETFFKKDEINAILVECGYPAIITVASTLEFQIPIGYNIKRADLIVKEDDQIYYFEVMSQQGGGNWDSYHHDQMFSKRTKLGILYNSENVHTFVVALKNSNLLTSKISTN